MLVLYTELAVNRFQWNYFWSLWIWILLTQFVQSKQVQLLVFYLRSMLRHFNLSMFTFYEPCAPQHCKNVILDPLNVFGSFSCKWVTWTHFFLIYRIIISGVPNLFQCGLFFFLQLPDLLVTLNNERLWWRTDYRRD